MNITWKEFKEEVDQKLKELGIDENTDIECIDVFIPQKGELDVDLGDVRGIAIF